MMEIRSLLHGLEDILYGGTMDKYITYGNHASRNCSTFLDRKLMALDTGIATAIMFTALVFAVKSYSAPPVNPASQQSSRVVNSLFSRRVLLAFMCILFGMELGYKICAKRLLYILYPCHVMTAVQIYLLMADVSLYSKALLRLLVPYLYGALLAMIFPDIEERMEFPGMLVIFWVQHFMIFFVVPPYLVYTFGIESLEPIKEWAWSCFSGIIFGIHHLFIMQPLALITEVNLNSVLCPFQGDPFNGPYYRLWAVFHQALCLLTIGKIYSLILYLLIPRKNGLKQY